MAQEAATPSQSAEEAAADWGISPETLRRLYREGKVPGYKCGRVLRFDPAELRATFRTAGAPTSSVAVVEPNFDALEVDDG